MDARRTRRRLVTVPSSSAAGRMCRGSVGTACGLQLAGSPCPGAAAGRGAGAAEVLAGVFVTCNVLNGTRFARTERGHDPRHELTTTAGGGRSATGGPRGRSPPRGDYTARTT